MRVTFWKEFGQLFIAIPSFCLFSFGFILAGIIAPLTPLLIAGIILLFVSLCFLFAPNFGLTKIVISEEGIATKWFNKQLAFLSWNKITETKTIPRGRGHVVLCFIENNKKIIIDPTKQIYDAIMIFCTNPNIKAQLKNDANLNWINKKK